MLREPTRQSYDWKKIPDKSEFPEGLADLIHEGWVLVYGGAEYIGLFIHSDSRCWIGYRDQMGEVRSTVCADPEEGKKRAELIMGAGLAAPRRRSRF